MAWGFAAGDLVALTSRLFGAASVIGLAVFFHRMYHMRMLMRRAQRDHGVVCATWFPDSESFESYRGRSTRLLSQSTNPDVPSL